jgi:hypothetical protein
VPTLAAQLTQVRKLQSEANSRLREQRQLARLATWGRNSSSALGAGGEARRSGPGAADKAKGKAKAKAAEAEVATPPEYTSAREVVTASGDLSEKEREVIGPSPNPNPNPDPNLSEKEREVISPSTEDGGRSWRRIGGKIAGALCR